MKSYALNFVISLSDWRPNGEFLGIHKLSVNPKDPPNISPQTLAHQKRLRTSIKPGLTFRILLYFNLSGRAQEVENSTTSIPKFNYVTELNTYDSVQQKC